jgi:hypothetical protein
MSMQRPIIGSILQCAYGDLYEQAICLKRYRLTHPEGEMKLFAATEMRLKRGHSGANKEEFSQERRHR